VQSDKEVVCCSRAVLRESCGVVNRFTIKEVTEVTIDSRQSVRLIQIEYRSVSKMSTDVIGLQLFASTYD